MCLPGKLQGIDAKASQGSAAPLTKDAQYLRQKRIEVRPFILNGIEVASSLEVIEGKFSE